MIWGRISFEWGTLSLKKEGLHRTISISGQNGNDILFFPVQFGTAVVFCLEYFGEVTSANEPDTIDHFRYVQVGVFDQLLRFFNPYLPDVVGHGGMMQQFETLLQF